MREIFEARRGIDPHKMSGFAIDFSDTLILLHQFDWDCFRLNGYTVIRDGDITRYRFLGRRGTWQSRALRHFRITPTRPGAISVASWRELIATVSRRYPLLTIHREGINPDVCYIGTVAALTERAATIKTLDCTGHWAGRRRFRLVHITRVDFGGRYEQALALTAPKRHSKK